MIQFLRGLDWTNGGITSPKHVWLRSHRGVVIMLYRYHHIWYKYHTLSVRYNRLVFTYDRIVRRDSPS